ncbi:MAG: polyisoprenoid-binding protein YceI [Phycisphaerales bacterium]|jgi:polyisoprenoid-binding protein YceI
MKNLSKASLITTAGLLGSAALLVGWTGTAGTADSTSSDRSTAETVTTTAREATPYTIEPVHSNVLFKIRHVGAANFYGRFNEFSGTVGFDEDAGELVSVNLVIPMESVDSNSARRDGHIKSGDFFNVGQYPTASFESTGYTATGDGTGTLTGNLTFLGETKEISADVVDIGTGVQAGTPKVGFEAHFEFQRTDYGSTTYVADDGGEDGPLGNTVQIIVAVEAAKD